MVKKREKTKSDEIGNANNSNSSPDSPPNPWKAMAVVGVIGVELAVLLLAGIWVGKQLDLFFETSPTFLIIGMFSGLAVGIWSVIKIVKPYLKD